MVILIVEKFKLGNTTIIICDDSYKNKTKEDMEKIIRRVEEIGSRALYNQELRKMKDRGGEKN